MFPGQTHKNVDRPITSAHADHNNTTAAAVTVTPSDMMLLGRNEQGRLSCGDDMMVLLVCCHSIGEHNFMGWVERVIVQRREEREQKVNKGRKQLEAEVEGSCVRISI